MCVNVMLWFDIDSLCVNIICIAFKIGKSGDFSCVDNGFSLKLFMANIAEFESVMISIFGMWPNNSIAFIIVKSSRFVDDAGKLGVIVINLFSEGVDIAPLPKFCSL